MSDLLRFLLQVIVIVAASRLAGLLMARLGHPPVIGEILAGILLGPCFFGWISPWAWAAFFPETSLSLLNTVSQFGLVLFMFLVGLRLDTSHVRAHGRSAASISLASIVVPFAGGVALALVVRERLAPHGVSTSAFAFFLGVAMSVTAFPVLARILDDTGLIRTPLGAIAIACAAIDDVIAWILLAAGAAMVHPGGAAWGRMPALIVVYGIVIAAAKPLLARLARAKYPLTNDRLAVIVLSGIMSAAATEWIGIHALFGAFFAGLVMPKKREFVDQVVAALQPLATLVLLPIFFASTGLRMNPPGAAGAIWLDGLLILVVGVAGKGAGAILAGRIAGLSWRDCASLGTLLNTRGLVELVVLNVGLDLGILTPALFSLMVLMALITTGMATPLLRILKPSGWERS